MLHQCMLSRKPVKYPIMHALNCTETQSSADFVAFENETIVIFLSLHYFMNTHYFDTRKIYNKHLYIYIYTKPLDNIFFSSKRGKLSEERENA